MQVSSDFEGVLREHPALGYTWLSKHGFTILSNKLAPGLEVGNVPFPNLDESHQRKFNRSHVEAGIGELVRVIPLVSVLQTTKRVPGKRGFMGFRVQPATFHTTQGEKRRLTIADVMPDKDSSTVEPATAVSYMTLSRDYGALQQTYCDGYKRPGNILAVTTILPESLASEAVKYLQADPVRVRHMSAFALEHLFGLNPGEFFLPEYEKWPELGVEKIRFTATDSIDPNEGVILPIS